MTRLPELLRFQPRLNSSTTFSFALAAVIIVTVTSYANAQTAATMLSPANGSTASGSITLSASITGTPASLVLWRDNWVQIGQRSSPELSFNSGSIRNDTHQLFVSVLDSTAYSPSPS